MNMLKKIKTLTALLFVCGLLASATLTSCSRSEGSADNAKEESAEHPAGDSTEQSKDEHPSGDSEHPKSDTTSVQQ